MLELGLMKMKHVVARAQISYMSEVVWDLEDSTLNKVILQEFELLGEKSSLAIVDKLAQDYGFEKVSVVRIILSSFELHTVDARTLHSTSLDHLKSGLSLKCKYFK